MSKRDISIGPSKSVPRAIVYLGRVILLLLVGIAPWWLGSVHKPAQFVVCCLAVLGLGVWWLELAISRARKQPVPILALVVSAGLLLGVLQMVPLPSFMATIVAPRQTELIAELTTPVKGEGQSEELASKLQPSPTLSLNPEGTQHYVQLLLISLICLLLASHYFNSRQSVSWLAIALTIQGTAMSVFAIYQRMNFNGKIYWIVELANGGKPFGPFVNRNNAGGYLLLCLAGSLGFAYLAFTKQTSGGRPRPLIGTDYPFLKRIQLHSMLFLADLTPAKIIAIVTTITIFSAVVISLSRGSIVALIVASTLTMWFVGFTKFPRATLLFSVATVGFTAALVGWLGYGDQLSNRFESFNNQDELMLEGRLDLWKNSLQIVPDYPVFGCGLNTFKDVSRGYRQQIETVYYEYAENVYVQSLVEMGIVGLVLLLAAIAIVVWSIQKLLSQGNSRKTAAAATIGTFALTAIATANIFDFGLYIPAVGILMAVICGFIAGQTHSMVTRSKRKSSLAVNVPSWLFNLAILVLFTSGVLACINLFGQARVSVALKDNPLVQTYQELPVEECQSQIDLLESLVRANPSSTVHKRLGELYLHRCRLQIFDRQTKLLRLDRFDTDRQVAIRDAAWVATDLIFMHRQLSAARRFGKREDLDKLLRDPIIVEHIPKVRANMLAARYYMPLDPGVHITLAQCQVFSSYPDEEVIHLERARKITPQNATIIFTTGILNLQSGRTELAKGDLRKCLIMQPDLFDKVVGFALVSRVSKRTIVKEILPNQHTLQSANLLFVFATTYLANEAEKSEKKKVMVLADAIIEKLPEADRNTLPLRAEIKKALEEWDEAIRIMELDLQLNPLSASHHLRLLPLYKRTENWEKAAEICRWLSRNHKYKAAYQKERNIYLEKIREQKRRGRPNRPKAD